MLSEKGTRTLNLTELNIFPTRRFLSMKIPGPRGNEENIKKDHRIQVWLGALLPI